VLLDTGKPVEQNPVVTDIAYAWDSTASARSIGLSANASASVLERSAEIP
jgi:hypothetical protein